MRLALSAREQQGVTSMLRSLLVTPHADGIDAWRMQVLTGMKQLFGADRAAMHLPLQGIERFISPDFHARSWHIYLRRYQPLDEKWTLWKRMLALGTFSRAQLYGRNLREYYRTEYYNDLIVPQRCFDMIGVAADVGEGARGESLAYIYLHHERPAGRRFGRRGMALLQMLQPAFVAGVEAVRRSAAGPRALVNALDTLAEGLLVTDRAGRILHASSALIRMTEGDPAAGRVLGAMQELARRLGSLHGRPEPALARLAETRLVRELTTVGGRYRMRGCLLDEAALGAGAAVLIALEILSAPRLPSVEQLQHRFRLTPAQARVALLIAEGLSDKKLAARLGIRPSTARHHAEQVRLKLGVSTRAAVVRRMLGD